MSYIVAVLLEMTGCCYELSLFGCWTTMKVDGTQFNAGKLKSQCVGSLREQKQHCDYFLVLCCFCSG
jgi:hypothetical protein